MPTGQYARKHENLVGRRFGMVVVTAEADRNGQGQVRWRCKCDCGGESATTGTKLKSGHTTSCGCVKRNALGNRVRTHGMRRHPLYGLYSGIIARCEDPRHIVYRFYGGRGISMPEPWRSDFAAFVRDMGPRPTLKHSIDRIDGDGNYEPGNCRWATIKEQRRNMRSNRVLSHDGRAQPAAAWAEEVGMAPGTLLRRIRLGWSVGEALTTEVRFVRR